MGGPKAAPIRERLLSKIAVDEITGCWNWVPPLHHSGYATLHADGRTRRAHRVSYEVHCGPIPDGMCVCHRCDNPKCINPEHLFLGTTAENVADRESKGRHNSPKGEEHGCAKLTDQEVIAIRRESGASHREIAAKYGVSRTTVTEVRSGVRWKHVRG